MKLSGPLPTLSIDYFHNATTSQDIGKNGALKIDSLEENIHPYAQSAIAIKIPNPRRFVIEGDVKTFFEGIWLGFRSSNGQWFRFGYSYASFCIQGNDMNSCANNVWGFRSYEDWMYLKVVVNDNVITGYIGTYPALTVNTNSVFMSGYVTAELWDPSDSITGWFDNITVYGY